MTLRVANLLVPGTALMCAAVMFAAFDARHRPPPRSGHVAAAVDGRLYVAGGDAVPTGQQRTLDCFTPGDSSWQALPPPPRARSLGAMVAIGARLYLFGGINSDGPVPDLDVFDIALRKWLEPVKHAPLPSRLAAAGLGDEIYLVGGLLAGATSPGEVCSRRVDAYNTRTGEWRRCADLAVGRHGHATAVRDGRLWISGGYGESGQIDSVEVYDPSEDRWRAGPTLLHPRAFHGMAEVGGRLWVYGQRGDDCSTEFLASQDRTWSDGPKMPRPRCRFASATVAQQIFVLDGEDAHGETPATVQVFNTDTQEWHVLPEYSAATTEPRSPAN